MKTQKSISWKSLPKFAISSWVWINRWFLAFHSLWIHRFFDILLEVFPTLELHWPSKKLLMCTILNRRYTFHLYFGNLLVELFKTIWFRFSFVLQQRYSIVITSYWVLDSFTDRSTNLICVKVIMVLSWYHNQ